MPLGKLGGNGVVFLEDATGVEGVTISIIHRNLHSLKYVPMILEPISYLSRKQERVSNRIILRPFSFPKSQKKVYITIRISLFITPTREGIRPMKNLKRPRKGMSIVRENRSLALTESSGC